MVFVRVFLLVTVQDAAEALDHSFFAQAMARNSSSSSAVVLAVAGSGASPPLLPAAVPLRLLLLAAVLHSLLPLAPAQCVPVPGTAGSQITEPGAARLPR